MLSSSSSEDEGDGGLRLPGGKRLAPWGTTGSTATFTGAGTTTAPALTAGGGGGGGSYGVFKSTGAGTSGGATFLTFGDSSDEEGEDAAGAAREASRRLEAKRRMLEAAAAAAAAAAAGGAGCAGKGKMPAKPSASSTSSAAAASGAWQGRQQREQQRWEVDSEDASTGDEMEEGAGRYGRGSSPSFRRRRPVSPAVAFKRKDQRAGAAQPPSSALGGRGDGGGCGSDSDATMGGEEEGEGGGAAAAATAGGGRTHRGGGGIARKKRPRPFSSSSSSSSSLPAAPPRPRSSGGGSDDSSSDSEADGEGDDALYPTIAKPLELGALEPLVLAARHPDDEEDGGKKDGGAEDKDGEEEEEEGDDVPPTQGPGEPVVVPAAANRYLQGYQRAGIKWLFRNYRGGQGCVLGDEMGLGKTIQVIAFLLALFRKKGLADADRAALRLHNRAVRSKPKRGHCALLVMPSSVLVQWKQELLKWGRFAVTTLDAKQQDGATAGGGGGATGDVAARIEEAARGGFEVVLCTYGGIKGQWGPRLQAVLWRVVVFDEFHQCKNKRSETYKAAAALRARIKIGLTGTPIQNNLDELWALLSIVAPKHAGVEAEFRADYADPIKRGQKRGASGDVLARCKTAEARLTALLDKVVLTRDKRTIAHKLHGKQEYVVFCKLTDIQYDVYRSVLALPEFQLLTRRRQPCDCSRRTTGAKRGGCCYKIPTLKATGGAARPASSSSSADGRRQWSGPNIDPRALIWKRLHPSGIACDKCPNCLTLACLSRLQKVASHPCLLQYNHAKKPSGSSSAANGKLSVAEEKANTKDFARLAFGKHAGQLGGLERTGNLVELCQVGQRACGKLVALDALLRSFGRRDKVLLFSYSVQMLDVLAAFATYKGYDYVRLDGSITGNERQAAIETFNRDESKTLFLISTRAGGLGLNLAVACKVICFDTNWNPTHDLQAMDRAYRLGQVRAVEVFRLVAQGTIEELCYMRQLYKMQLTDVTLDGVTEAPASPSSQPDGGDDEDDDGDGGGSGGKRKGTKRGRRKRNATKGVAFRGVMGDKGEEGELFGVENLLQLSRGSILAELRRKAEALAMADDDGGGLGGDEGEEEGEGDGGEGKKMGTREELLARQVAQMAQVAARAKEHLRRQQQRRQAQQQGGGGGDAMDEGGGVSCSQEGIFDAELPVNEILNLLGLGGREGADGEGNGEVVDEIEEADSDWSGGGGGKGKGKAKRVKREVVEEDDGDGSDFAASPTPPAATGGAARAGGRASPLAGRLGGGGEDGDEQKKPPARKMFIPSYLKK